MKSRSSNSSQPMGFWGAVSIIIGIVVGVGIHETVPKIFSSVDSAGSAILCWLAGGFLAVTGALCFAELAASIPRAGGDYQYLKKAYGGWAGFLFGWMQLTIIKPASIGMAVFIFADYARNLLGINGPPPVYIPVLAAASISAINIIGVRSGIRTQAILTIFKIVGFGGVILSGLIFGNGGTGEPIAATDGSGGTDFALAMILIMYAYGGWNDAALVTSEVRNPQKNLPKALLVGVGLITIIYLLVILAYLRGLGFEQAGNSSAIAAKVLQLSLGEFGDSAMSILIMIAALGAANGMVFAGARVYTAMGADYPAFKSLAHRNRDSGAPRIALVTEGSITILLILLVGSEYGHSLINWALVGFGGEKIDWSGRSGFSILLDGTAVFFWGFFFLTGLSLFVLRARFPTLKRPFRVPLYPVIPFVFCASSAFMCYRAAIWAEWLSFLGLVSLVAGLVVFSVIRKPTSGSSEGESV